ncbi:hypothetical protein [Ruegeria sp. HKCCD7255]|uniref:hypothetical protein n=1 Tax=Ruegeria sp. HKCCD7255 TaxID=2683004 RepID=UPI0020C3B072|nr:hypothetical protein [Ruegeria sp. HKCCD7255]
MADLSLAQLCKQRCVSDGNIASQWKFLEIETFTNDALTMLGDAARMCRFVSLLLVCLALCGPAWSGAWLREKGTAFTAFSATAFKEDHGIYSYKTSFYSEWGLRPKLTIGLDAEERHDYYGHALVFARFPLADFNAKGRLAGEIGVGAHHEGLRAWALYKATLSYGKGFDSAFGNGWIAIDSALEYRHPLDLFRKLDFTVGLSSKRRFDPLLQIETTYISGQPLYWAARPSLMYRPKSGKQTWIIGIEANAVQNRPGLKFALWQTY